MTTKTRTRSDLLTYVDREPTALWTASALAVAATLIAARFHFSAAVVLAMALFASVFTFGVLWAITLYPRTYLGARWASLAFMTALFLLCDGIGRVGFQIQWRRSFEVNGPWKEFTDRGKIWTVRIPAKWQPYELFTGATGTVIFKPSRLTPAIEFSVTHHPRPNDRNLAETVEAYYLNLPKSADTKILAGAPFNYAPGQEAYRMVHQDPRQALVLRQENIFLFHQNDLYMLTVTAVPAWFDRFPADLQRFIGSLRFTA